MAEDFGLLHTRDGDCADRRGGDCDYCRDRVPADEKESFCQGCGWCEGREHEDDEEGCAEEDRSHAYEDLMCLLSTGR